MKERELPYPDAVSVQERCSRLLAIGAVDVHLVEFDQPSGTCSMLAIHRIILRNPRPTLVIGSTPPVPGEEFAALLDLPFVRFLRSPFTEIEFESAALAVQEAPIEPNRVAEARRAASSFAIRELRRGIKHTLDGIEGLVELVLGAVGHEGRNSQVPPPSEWQTILDALSYYVGRLEDARNALFSDARDLGGIATLEVSNVMERSTERLSEAHRSLAEFAACLAELADSHPTRVSAQGLRALGMRAVAAIHEADSALR